MRVTRLQARERDMLRKQVVKNIKHQEMHTATSNDKNAATRKDKSPQFYSTKPHNISMGHGGEQAPFPLFSLPVEIQTMIYEFALYDTDKVLMLDNCNTPPLARTNRHLRQTTLPIFLHINTFHLFTEEAPQARLFPITTATAASANASKPGDLQFKIQASVLEWLSKVGEDAPLFQRLIVHLGVGNADTELVIEYLRAHGGSGGGMQISHGKNCKYCNNNKKNKLQTNKTTTTETAQTDTPSTIPTSLLTNLTHNKPTLQRLITQAQTLHSAMATEHDTLLGEISTTLFGRERSGLDSSCRGFSVGDVMKVEKAINLGNVALAVAQHGINLRRVRENPLWVIVGGVRFSLV
jgi:hypothetical protein